MRIPAIEIKVVTPYTIPMNKETGLIAGITDYLSRLGATLSFVCDDDNLYGLTDMLANEGFRILGSGSYRVGLVHPSLPNVVFKLAYASHGQECCKDMGRAEYDFYHTTATEMEKKYLAEPYHCADYVCAMERVTTDGTRRTGYFRDMPVPRRKLYEDARYTNYVIVNGEYKLFDYAPMPWNWAEGFN